MAEQPIVPVLDWQEESTMRAEGDEGLRERAEAIAAFVSGPDDGGICPSCSTMYERPRHEWAVCKDENHVRVFGGPHEVYDYFCPNCGYHFAHWHARDAEPGWKQWNL